MKKINLFLLALIILGPACFWDNDTLEMERQQFPSVLELISGNFLRHSDEFYRWKITDRQKKIESYPDSLPLYDDMSVAFSKVGEHKKAIEIAKESNKKKGNRYETLSNMGTFYMLDGNWEEGIKWIDKALEVNPNAHFGREKYQKYLAEYLIENKKQNKSIKLPLQNFNSPAHRENDVFGSDFSSFLKNKKARVDSAIDTKRALIAVMGMMKFANHESPILLEVLGDLLQMGPYANEEGAKKLSAFCYLRASDVSDNLYTKAAYDTLAINATEMDKELDFLPDFPSVYKKLNRILMPYQKSGKSFFEKLKENETNWIKQGLNPEEEFAKKYYSNPLFSINQLSNLDSLSISGDKEITDLRPTNSTTKENTPVRNKNLQFYTVKRKNINTILLISAISFVAISGGVFVFLRMRKKRKKSTLQ